MLQRWFGSTHKEPKQHDVWPYANVCRRWTTFGIEPDGLQNIVMDAMQYRFGDHVEYVAWPTFQMPEQTDALLIGLPCAEGLLQSYLDQWHTRTYRFIMIVGTTRYRDKSSFVLLNQDVCSVSLKYGVPYETLLQGSAKTIQSFLRVHTEWVLHKEVPIWDGLTILARVTRGDYQG